VDTDIDVGGLEVGAEKSASVGRPSVRTTQVPTVRRTASGVSAAADADAEAARQTGISACGKFIVGFLG